MRDRSGWHRPLLEELRDAWPAELVSFPPGALCDVELGLYLREQVMPARTAAEAWTLFGGYPYGEAFGDVRTDQQRLLIRRARHYLWSMRRRRTWHTALTSYLAVPQELRGYDLGTIEDIPRRRQPARAARRFDRYRELLAGPPAFARVPLPLAGAGEYWFAQRERRHSVTFTDDLVAGPDPVGHDLRAAATGSSAPLRVTWSELEQAAAEMDAIEAAAPDRPNDWVRRLGRVKLLIRSATGREFVPGDQLRIDDVVHLVGMVGAGKSTLRDVLAFRAAQRGLRVTIVVGDVAETLAVVDQFNRLGTTAAPILGHSTRERHIQRLHRRLATAGAPSMLAHTHPGFAFLNSACPLDALRGLEAGQPLRIAEAPCASLYPTDQAANPLTALAGRDDADASDGARNAGRRNDGRKPRRHGCPLWTRCPRHHGARQLVDARIWVATPASLVHSGVPQHQNAERLRYLELACRRSDLIIVDEADRVQMQLDAAFAPATTLVGRSPDSWLDEVQGHKITELARQGRLQLSEQDIDDWTNALNTVSAAADRLYALLVQEASLRTWAIEDYFSAFTLHLRLLNEWFPDLKAGEPDRVASLGGERETREQRRAQVSAILDRFRDDPLEHRPAAGDTAEVAAAANDLVHLTLELLHAHRGASTRERLREALLSLVGHDPRIDREMAAHAQQFEFTLLLAALHNRLDYITTLWSRVEAALNLESTSNVLSRRPPKDYEPLIPESPMGNVLGFQFRIDDRTRGGERSGELRFFRCGGIGRELLLGLHQLPAVDGRPGPKVLMMSATSWAGSSSRYHVHLPVGAVLRPHDEEAKAVLGTEFRKEFLYSPNGAVLRLSGSDPAIRPRVLEQMLQTLAEPDRTLTGATSKLEDELADIPDAERRRILLLVGSYAEARRSAEYLNRIPEWTGRITLLVSDDTDLDDAWRTLPSEQSVKALRRGDVRSFPKAGGEILVAPLLAVERGHNIVLPGGKAAIGTAYFLARPHPRPDDMALAVQAINDWAVRYVRDGQFRQMALAAGSPDAAGLRFRALARNRWQRLLTRTLAWTSLPDDEKESFTWDQLVVIWQVIGRLVRGGAPARVVFVDAAFSPREAGLIATDTPATSLLLSMRGVLDPYFDDNSDAADIDRSLVQALYEPLYRALADLD
jgi:hypothetical protein